MLNREEWKIEKITHRHYAIFHKEESLEWEDENGDNLCFETRKEAELYLNDQFKI